MDCPATTGFDTKLRICNYIKALPRCSKEQSRTLYREIDGVINAKQTRQLRPYASISGPSRSFSLETPKAGYLKTNRGFNANIDNYSKNHVLNSHEAYSIPITSTHNSATTTTKTLKYFNHLIIMAITAIILILK
jgi:hypothetical protein